jgi:hypothetical protein
MLEAREVSGLTAKVSSPDMLEARGVSGLMAKVSSPARGARARLGRVRDGKPEAREVSGLLVKVPLWVESEEVLEAEDRTASNSSACSVNVSPSARTGQPRICATVFAMIASSLQERSQNALTIADCSSWFMSEGVS